MVSNCRSHKYLRERNDFTLSPFQKKQKDLPKRVLVTSIRTSEWLGSLMCRARKDKMLANPRSSRPASAVFKPSRRMSSSMSPMVVDGFFFRTYGTRTASSALLYWNFFRNLSYLGTRPTSFLVATSMSVAGFNGRKSALMRKR